MTTLGGALLCQHSLVYTFQGTERRAEAISSRPGPSAVGILQVFLIVMLLEVVLSRYSLHGEQRVGAWLVEAKWSTRGRPADTFPLRRAARQSTARRGKVVNLENFLFSLPDLFESCFYPHLFLLLKCTASASKCLALIAAQTEWIVLNCLSE